MEQAVAVLALVIIPLSIVFTILILKVTRKQNNENRKGAHGRSGIRGVHSANGRWCARVGHHGKAVWAGTFDTPEEAAEAARIKRLELFSHSDTDRRAAG